MTVRTVVASASKSKKYQPEDIDQISDIIALWMEELRAHEANRVLDGLQAGTPTTASSQLTGATGVTEWRINLDKGLVTVGGVIAEIAAAADTVIHDTTVLVTNGQSCVARVVAKKVSGTITVVTVKGTPATTGSQVAPTDTVVQAAVGSGNDWVELAQCTLNRTGDTTVTQTQNNTYRPVLGVNVASTFGNL